VYFGKLVFESDEQEFSLRGVKSKKISSHPGRDLLKSVLKVRNASVKVEWVETEEEPSAICTKVVVKGKGRDQSTERVVYMMKSRGPRTEPWGTTRVSMKGREVVITFNTKEARW